MLAGRVDGVLPKPLPGPGQHLPCKAKPQLIMLYRARTSPLLAASAMPALGAMPGAYPWTLWILFQEGHDIHIF